MGVPATEGLLFGTTLPTGHGRAVRGGSPRREKRTRAAAGGSEGRSGSVRLRKDLKSSVWRAVDVTRLGLSVQASRSREVTAER